MQFRGSRRFAAIERALAKVAERHLRATKPTLKTPPRIDLSLAVEVRTAQQTVQTTTRNMSHRGMCLESAVQLFEGESVQLEISFLVEGIIKQAHPVAVEGRVLWSAENYRGLGADRAFVSGIEFSEPDEQLRELLTWFQGGGTQ